MDRDAVFHLVRAAARIVGVRRMLVIGSQAIWGSVDAASLPTAATRSIEADLVAIDLVRGEPPASDRIDGAIGFGSQFHQTFGYYADGVDLETATFPAGWKGRLVTRTVDRDQEGPIEAYFPEVHDLCLAKLAANREKDHDFVSALLREGLVDRDLLQQRARTIEGVDRAGIQTVLGWLA